MKIDSIHALLMLLLAWPSSARPTKIYNPVPHGAIPVIHNYFREMINNGRQSFQTRLHDSDGDVIMLNCSPKKRRTASPPKKKRKHGSILKTPYQDTPGHGLSDGVCKLQISKEEQKTEKPALPGTAVSELGSGIFTVTRNEVIGKGSYGVVYRGLSESKELIAVKVIDVKEMVSRNRITERRAMVEILQETDLCRHDLQHKNIMQCAQPRFDYDGDFAEIATEFCEEGDLRRKIESKSLSEAEAKCNFWQLLSGLDYMHSQKVVHRDIKPDNLFLKTSGLLKIGDFGLARRLPLHDKEANGRRGTTPYMAPEMFLTGGKYDPLAADIWASAITHIESRTFEFPWDIVRQDESRFKSFQSDRRGFLESIHVDGSKQAKFSNEEIDVLTRMMELDPSKRITARDLMQLPWIQSLKKQCSSSVLSNY